MRLAIVALVALLASCSEPTIDAQQVASDELKLVGVASVIDGDTIEIHGRRIRLSGFDAPESGSKCGTANVYQRASLALSDYIGTRTVSCGLTGAKTHEREVGICTVAGKDIGEVMVEAGWARDWPRYSKGAYADEEATARSAKRGIWGLSCPTDLWGNRNYAP